MPLVGALCVGHSGDGGDALQHRHRGHDGVHEYSVQVAQQAACCTGAVCAVTGACCALEPFVLFLSAALEPFVLLLVSHLCCYWCAKYVTGVLFVLLLVCCTLAVTAVPGGCCCVRMAM